jgi:signal transduction histidine kinase/ActR/RegA family two-component response regulator
MDSLVSPPLVNASKELNLHSISMAGRVRLLEIAYSRFRFGLFAMPLVSSMFVWYYWQSSNDYRVLVWALCYACATALAIVQYKIYLRDMRSLPAEAMFTRWLPRIENTALVHGFGMAVVLPLVGQTASIEFKYLYLVTLAAIMAGNGIDQAPMPSVYHRFLLTGWNLMVLSMPWSFPQHWPFLMPLAAIFGVMKYWNSTGSNNFFIQLVWHEEEGARLVKVYKTANEEAAEALNEKNLFLATASHDLRQPIHAMSMLVEAIGLRNQDKTIQPLLVDLKSSMNSMSQMFNSLLDLSKLEAGILQPRAVPVALPLILREVVQLFREQATTHGLALRLRLPKRDATVLADPVLLRQALVNLTHNALRYTQNGGVLLGVRQRGDDWLIEVWDTGIGIAAEDEQQVFSAYYRSELAWRVDSAGHGLGLAVVARCAKLMGATYGVSSRMGKGSRFWLRLAAHRAPAQALAATAARQSVQTAGFQPLTGRCLVLDDDVHVIAAWRAMLEGWGVEGRYATTATQALAHVDGGFYPQAIFCDQRLRSGESGFDILRALLLRCPNASGAMVSGEFNSSDLVQAEGDGYLVLRKPLDLVELYAVLETWLKKPNVVVEVLSSKCN